MLQFHSNSKKTQTRNFYSPQDDEIILRCVREASSALAGLRQAASLIGRGFAGVNTRYNRILKPLNTTSSNLVHRGRTPQIGVPSSTLSAIDSSSLQVATLAKIVDKLNPQNKQLLVHYVLNL